MSKYLCIAVFLLLNPMHMDAQSYEQDLMRYREHYKQEFLEDKNSPLKAKDTAYLQFYAPDEQYKVLAAYEISGDTTPFKMQTHSGKIKMYRKCGIVRFVLNDKQLSLEVYQSMDLLKQKAYSNYLFIPFNDLTNYETTYAGGRYLDLSLQDVKDGKIIIDFNKCYNPYCAYASGYSCPIPPDANKLKVRIEAGEKSYGKAVE